MVDEILQFADLKLDPRKYHTTKSGQPLHLTPREFSLLEFFMRHPGQVFSLESLIDRIWQSQDAVTYDSLRVCIKRLRAKIDTPGCASFFTTIHGTGYIFDQPETTQPPGTT
jgi:DNA-binding response OmpR family regulator